MDHPKIASYSANKKLTGTSKAFRKIHFSISFSVPGFRSFGAINIATSKNFLSKNGTRTSTLFAMHDLSARKQSEVERSFTRRIHS